MNKKGFTLIELLVVVAIIGILTSVGFVQFSGARNKANDAKVQSNVATISTQIEVNKNTGAWTDATIDDNIDALIADPKFGASPCGDNIYHRMPATDGVTSINDEVAIYADTCVADSATGFDIFCADSQGYRGYIETAPTTGACQ